MPYEGGQGGMGINCGEKKNTLYLRWRFVFEETKCKYIYGIIPWYMLAISIAFMISGYFFGTGISGDKQWDMYLFIGKGIAAILFAGALIDNIKYNRLLKKGKLIIAEIDNTKDTLHPFFLFCTQTKVKCSYFDYEKEKLYEYKGVFTSFDRSGVIDNALWNEEYIPVLVDENDYSKYFVLTKELAQSYWWKHYRGVFQKPIYFTKPIREIDLTQVENGLRFSNDVRFQ